VVPPPHDVQYTLKIISRSFLLRMRNVTEKSCKENYKTYLMFSDFFSRKSCLLRATVEKCCRAGQATDNNTALAHCMLYTQGYTYTLRICNVYCFSTVTIVRTRLNVALYLHCLTYFII
jgi:hypothetical protein